MSKTALAILTDNFEEIEAVTPIDILRRAEVEVTIASRTNSFNVKGRSNITIVADCLLDSALADGKTYDLVLLPGGPGHTAMRTDTRVLELVKKQVEAGRVVGAICAAPTVLKDAGVIKGKKITAHFSVMEELPNMLQKEDVVKDGVIITSRGAGTAIPFALALVEKLCGYEKALKIAHAICSGMKSIP
jgi:protein deglycase